MLNSILPFLEKNDHLTLIFDGVSQPSLTLETEGTIHTFEEEKGQCWPCHHFRNKYASKLHKTDFVMHADDDDVYTENAFKKIRSACQDLKTLYIFKMEIVNHKIVPSHHVIVPGKIVNAGEIGTPNGVIPFDLNCRGIWQLKYGGDWDFYKSLETHCKNIIYIDEIIYRYYCRDFM